MPAGKLTVQLDFKGRMVSRIREFWVIGSGCASQERGVECGSCHTQGVEKGTHLLGPGWRHDMKGKGVDQTPRTCLYCSEKLAIHTSMDFCACLVHGLTIHSSTMHRSDHKYDSMPSPARTHASNNWNPEAFVYTPCTEAAGQ